MKNNRKQKIENMLDSLSQKELEDYMSKREFMNIKIKEMLNTINTNRKYNHSQIISNKLSDNIQKSINGFYKMGEAHIIAFVLECFYDQKYKIKDLKEYLKAMIDHDKELKEYVYDMRKDF